MLAIDADQSIWWANQVKLVHLTNGHLTTFALPPHQLHALASDPRHGVWLGTSRGLAYSDGNALHWPSLSLDACTIPAPTDIAIDSQGSAWTITWGKLQTLALGETAWQPVPDSDLISSYDDKTIYAVAAAPDKGVWVQGYRLGRFGGAATPSLVRTSSLWCPGNLLQMQVDKAGNIWKTAGDCGVVQFIPSARGGKWVRHIPGGRIESVALGTDGAVYAAGSQGMFVFTGKIYPDPPSTLGSAWRPAALNLPRDLVLAADRDSGVWLGSPQTGELWHYRAGQMTSLDQQFERDVLLQLYVDRRNRLWAGVQDRLAVYDGKTWKSLSAPAGIISKLTGGPDGRIWVLGSDALAVYDPAADMQP